METEAIQEPVDEYQKISARIADINAKDKDAKASYNELRTVYSVICNDIKAAIFKRLVTTVDDLKRWNRENVTPKFIKKDAYIQTIERSLNDFLEETPDLNPQNMQSTMYFLRDLFPILIRLKARHANNMKLEKKAKKVRVQQNIIYNINHISMELHALSNVLTEYQYFENFALTLIRVRYNKDDINRLIREIQGVVKQLLKTTKNEILDINKFRVIDHLTLRIIIRLSIYEYSGLYTTFEKMMKRLPGQLIKQFNVRYAARKRDKQEVADDVKKSDAYLNITKKFVNLKLEKFHELQNAYLLNMGKLFQADLQISAEFNNMLGRLEGIRNPDTRMQIIDKFHDSVIVKLDTHNKIVKSPTKDEEYANISLKSQFVTLVNYYYNILKDILTPQNWRDLGIKYTKMLKPQKDMLLNGTELKLLGHKIFTRNDDVLKIFLEGILALVLGKDEEKNIIDLLLAAIGVESRKMRSEDMRHRTIQEFVDAVSPEEINVLMEMLEILPPDRQRLGTQLGAMYMDVAQKYPDSIKWKLDHAEKIQPTDSDIEKLKKTTNEKLNSLFFKAVGHQTERPAPITVLQSKLEEERTYLDSMDTQTDLAVKHEVNSLLAFWRFETDKSVVDFCLGNANKIVPSVNTKKLNKADLRKISNKFNSDYLTEIEKHYKTLNESIGNEYLKSKQPYFQLEHILLFASKALLMGFRSPEKSYPRLYERMTAIFGSAE